MFSFFWLFSSIYYFLIAILTITGNITESDRKKGQVLDTLKVERERGKGIITSIYVYRHFAEYWKINIVKNDKKDIYL